MSGVDAVVSYILLRKRRSREASSTRSQISVACLLSEQVLRSTHDIEEWRVSGCWFAGRVLCATSVVVVSIGAVGVVVQAKR